MKIGIIKPDYKIVGGFEIVVFRLKYELEKIGHRVDIVNVDAMSTSLENIPFPVDQDMVFKNPEFFRYIDSFWKYLKMQLNQYDTVISTQPPSFAIEHKHHISLFYHHMKIYYDLSNLIQEVGLQLPYHNKAVEVIREIDSVRLSKVSTILAGSETVKTRLQDYNLLKQNIDVIYAGIDQELFDYDGPITYESPIVVGRHEFPKRPELFVSAMKRLPELTGRVIGTGGRTDDVKKIDKLLSYTTKENINIPDEVIWKKLSNGFFSNEYEQYYRNSKKIRSNIVFTGRVTKKQLIEEYSKALCVVCPAYEEDYGLTAIEAMALRKPVIACKDGGGYTELIEDGINGFVVSPTSQAIAEVIEYLNDNKELAKKMGNAAYEKSRQFTWENTINKLVNTINI